MKQGLGKLILREQVKKFCEAHSEWFVKQTLMDPTWTCDVKGVKYHANKWLSRVLNIANLEMIADCNLIILPLI